MYIYIYREREKLKIIDGKIYISKNEKEHVFIFISGKKLYI